MPSVTAEELRELLERGLPGALATPASPGLEAGGRMAEAGALVEAARILDAAVYLRDALGYTLLSNITATDYMADGAIELVYHFAHLGGGPVVALRLRVPRDDPEVPSLTPIWPGADFQEREAFDMYGVRFAGHPNLRRIYMWDEFEGFPMRKDFPKQGDKYLETAAEE